jgi:Leucine-rich repeat (LRR) protein
LALTENKLTGPIPDSLASLTNLAVLALDDNFLTGDLAVLEDLTELQNVYLEQNGFSQVIDAKFLNKLTRLSALDISDNAFIGEVPVHLMALQSFIVMDVHDNTLTSFPNNIDKNTQVRFLSIHDNPIEGAPFPNTVSHMTHLRHLDITSTNFSGEMPSFLGDLKDIFYLFMADTEFKPGPIPDNYQSLTNLQDFSVKSSGRNGTIPLWFAGLDNMLLLDLDDNELTGEIPGQLADMSSLRYLLLNRNKLSGEIPTEFNTASNIRK